MKNVRTTIRRACRPFLSFCVYFYLITVGSADTRPNILFIYTDDQSHRTLSCYAEEGARPWVNTPNIDRLAAEGVRFSKAYGASWCAPSRASVLTGQLQHGIRGVDITTTQDPERSWAAYGNAIDRSKAQMWPVLLREEGYETAMIGKWHLGQDANHGWLWDYSAVWDQNTPKGDWYNDQALSINGGQPELIPGYATDVYTDLAKSYIEDKRDKPWMLWLNYNAPHLPNTVHPRHDQQYDGADIPVPPDVFGPRPDKPDYMVDRSMFEKAPDGTPIWGRRSIPELVLGYNRLVSAIDEGVGELLRSLEATGQLNNTLIIFTSDQGFAWGERGYAWKVGPYDACLQMPLIFRLPGRVARGGVAHQPATIVDVVPTLLHFAELDVPWKLHGRDLSPLLRDPGLWSDRPAFMENFRANFGRETDEALTRDDATKGVPWWLFVTDGRFKYIRTLVPNQIEELYDLERDPEELVNLARDPIMSHKLVEMRQMLEGEMKRTEAPFIDNLPRPKMGY